MTRLVDLRAAPVGDRLALACGDLVLLPAAGGTVLAGTAVEMLGAYRSALAGRGGAVLAPAGAPDVVVLVARAPGEAIIRWMTGDPFRGAQANELAVTVADAP